MLDTDKRFPSDSQRFGNSLLFLVSNFTRNWRGPRTVAYQACVKLQISLA